METKKIVQLAVGEPLDFVWEKGIEHSGIGKTNVNSAELKKFGFIGDRVANPEFHGGVDRAVCLYPFEHYRYWEERFGQAIALPAFGENITATGMLEKDVCIGDVYQIGSTVLQVTQGRIPCSTISKFNRIEPFLHAVFETSFTGYFFRVLEEGTINVDSPIQLLEQEPNRVSVLFANQILFHNQDDRAGVEKVLKVEALAEVWKRKLMKFL